MRTSYNVANQLTNNTHSHDVVNLMRRVLTKEAQSIHHLIEYFPVESSSKLVSLILNTSGSVVATGIGKSGIVAKKVAATLSSLGISAFFMHPTDALHGDVGMMQRDDICIIFSKSGTKSEYESLISHLKMMGNVVVMVTCYGNEVAKLVDHTVFLPFKEEACPLNLAPTSSTTMMMSFGDAIAIAASQLHGFSDNDFARLHPGGSLGRTLSYTVYALMHKVAEVPLVTSDTSFQDLLIEITQKKLGVGLVVDNQGTIVGLITDGDLRRACKQGPSVFSKTAGNIMTPNPEVITSTTSAYQALITMENLSITSLVVVNKEQRPEGLIHIHDIIKAGIMP